MNSNELNLSQFQTKEVAWNENIDWHTIVHSESRAFINELTFFTNYFHYIPNLINENDINCLKAIQWFNEEYKDKIIDCYYNKRYLNNSKVPELDDVFFILDKDLLVCFDINCSKVKFLFRKTENEIIERIFSGIKRFKNRCRKRSPRISLLITTNSGIDTKSLKIAKPKLSIEDNYNEDFKEIHRTILRRLNKKNDKGLILLHGKPGTGKTSYIRYLISMVNKEVIFLPPNMASAITNPTLMSTLIENPNSIFVIEDAENIIMDRENNGNSPVSALLNISDGLLSDCLNIQIICSFNTDITKVDSALMRKGRMIAKYEFKELSIDKAQALSNKLSFKTIISKPMTLTEIYNQEEMSFMAQKERVAIGFRREQIA